MAQSREREEINHLAGLWLDSLHVPCTRQKSDEKSRQKILSTVLKLLLHMCRRLPALLPVVNGAFGLRTFGLGYLRKMLNALPKKKKKHQENTPTGMWASGAAAGAADDKLSIADTTL